MDMENIDEFESSDEEVEEESDTRQRPYNDQESLESKLKQVKTTLKWLEHLDVTVNVKDLNVPGEDSNKNSKSIGIQSTNEDDFKREMLFYCQAQVAAKEALSRLRDMKIPTERPEDYFAEMVKTDTHMHKIRQKLQDRKEGMEKSEKAKKQRQLKKIGKKVQQDVLKKRQEEKKKMLATVDRIKKGKGKLEDLSKRKDDDMFNVSRDDDRKSGQKRKHKDDKFGFGGKKRKIKKNSADSSGDMTSFKPNVHGKGKNPNRNQMGNKNKSKGKRLGKSRRTKTQTGRR